MSCIILPLRRPTMMETPCITGLNGVTGARQQDGLVRSPQARQSPAIIRFQEGPGLLNAKQKIFTMRQATGGL